MLILDGEENELILPKSEADDYFKKGDSIRAVVKSVGEMLIRLLFFQGQHQNF